MIIKYIYVCFIPSDIGGKLDADQEYTNLKKIVCSPKTSDHIKTED